MVDTSHCPQLVRSHTTLCTNRVIVPGSAEQVEVILKPWKKNIVATKEQISDKKKMYQSGTRESSFPAFLSCQGLMTFRDISDTVLHLSDEDWTTLTEDMTHQYTKLKFASLCTDIVMSVSESVIGKMMPDLIERFGIESVLRAEAKLKEKDECESRSHCATPSCSGQRLPEDSSDLVHNSIETAITKIKAAMQEAIRRVATGKKLKTAANKIIKSLKKISHKSHVKLESGD
ncbi:hypothetical protein AMELA_G00128190 [Ameiurus melas]|uniref:Uncharacterized protein n=1 Tax=Ameiurus melas TaxID=219545 RepID=A0A7J6AND9_AMEME|nr:hypothetical protein AMELA_G00128190 [Ameiurus melas]